MRHILISLIAGIVLSACTGVDKDSVGSEISVTPVRYQLEISIDNSHAAQEQLESFIDMHANQLEGRELQLVWYTHRGKAFLDKFKRPDGAGYTVRVIRAETLSPHFDIRAQFSDSILAIEPCSRDEMGDYGDTVGCYTENARWQSMVNPHDAI
ncbi:hypothetical protein L3Q72_02530 [Vibrio sp. JC009]|uniref:hypothetical protein n=1 Tax=Vibrio sp. JC009 TaxID=2912314 RepID=UPI0023AF719D|nr:hypothetical protein [Vibrio sp. JC009]WED22298.1 hypothetical protein L3Q72_02530 [Vibrio sp. JC009]